MLVPRFKIRMSLWRAICSLFSLSRLYSFKHVNKFESKFSSFTGSKYSVGMPMARVGIEFALRSLKLNEGDEVLVSSTNIPDVISAVVNAKLRPVFVDSEKDSFNMSVDSIEKRLSSRTRVIIITHFAGIVQDSKIFDVAKKNNLFIIEDCAQSLGSEKYVAAENRRSDMSVFSFGSYKTISSYYGGAVCTDDKELYQSLKRYQVGCKMARIHMFLCRMLRDMLLAIMISRMFFPLVYLILKFNVDISNFMVNEKQVVGFPSKFYYRFSDFNALLLNRQMSSIMRINRKREELSKIYLKAILTSSSSIVPNSLKENSFSFPIFVSRRDNVREKLLNFGIDSYVGNMKSCAYDKRFKKFFSECKHSKENMKKVLFLPLFPEISSKEAEQIGKYLSQI